MKRPPRAAHAKALRLPWEFPLADLDAADVEAVQAIAAGTANEHQQRRAWVFIREKLCRCEQTVFWPGGEDGRRATDFAAGMAFVAQYLRRMSRLKPERVDARGEPPPMPAQPTQDRGE